MGAVSVGGFVRLGKLHTNTCPGLLAAAAADTPQSPEWSRSPLADQSHWWVHAAPFHLGRRRARGT